MNRTSRVSGVLAAVGIVVAAALIGATAAALTGGSERKSSGTVAPIGETPSAKPSTPPKVTGPASVKLNPAKLKSGAAPSAPYLLNRKLVGDGPTVAIPGDGTVTAVVRSKARTLVLLDLTDPSGGTELVSYDGAGKQLRRIPDVSDLYGSPDGRSAAWVQHTVDEKGPVPGATLTFSDLATGRNTVLDLPKDLIVVPIGIQDGVVLFVTAVKQAMQLHSWKVGDATATLIDKPTEEPILLSPDQRSLVERLGEGVIPDCDQLVNRADGTKLWQNCSWLVREFSPDSRTVLTAPKNITQEDRVAIFDVATGKLIRQWTVGTEALEATIYEDDDHVLFTVAADDRRIVRCTISDGTCEQATKPVGIENFEDYEVLPRGGASA
ncbi:hypothetical protein AB0P21_29450 [Kribbella sp. NPDC056861]|uniref:hypothetical protein n=1 Tax=Kribbella sp. NPDC056861 TaxID=3154857 RepID=UPI0034170F73